MRARVLVVVAAALLASALQAASARAAGRVPLRVGTASLVQDATQLVWRLELDHSFSPTAIKRDHRSLCLLIERARNGTVAGALCVEPAGAGQPRLRYMRVTRAGWGAGHVIAGTVIRPSDRALTARFLPLSVGIPVGYRSLRWQVLSTVGSPTCPQAASPGPHRLGPLGCRALYPAKPALTRLHAPQPVGCVPAGAPFVYNGSRSRRVVALTFDDGPWPDTPQFLDVLEREHVHATFFQIGNQVATYGRAVDRRMLADGDVIGDHTFDHANVSAAGSFAAGEISRTAAAIRQLTGFTPCLFRAPYGAVSSALIGEARSMGFATIQWDVDPSDYSRPGTGTIYQRVVSGARNGSIVIQHDGGGDRSQTLAALPGEIATLRRRGYRFVTVPELLGQRLIYR
ncbi:MAG: polysaccharide deacetylase family protein [Solirubrobacteraceae bacterium]